MMNPVAPDAAGDRALTRTRTSIGGVAAGSESEATGVLNFWVDGLEVGPWENLWMRTTEELEITILWLSLFHHGEHSDVGVLYDNVIVSSERIGCLWDLDRPQTCEHFFSYPLDMSVLFGEPEDWGNAPRKLGMTVDEDGVLRGVWGGNIAVSGHHTWRTARHRGTDGRERTVKQRLTLLSAELDPPLMMGIRLTERSLSGRLRDSIFGQKDIQVGNSHLDKHFEISGVEPDHVQQVFAGKATNELVRAHALTPTVEVSDTAVTVERLDEWERRVERLQSGLEAVARVAAALLKSRSQMPAGWEPALREGWSAAAGLWGLKFEAPLASMHGSTRGVTVDVALSPDGLRTGVRVTLTDPLACNLDIKRHGKTDDHGLTFDDERFDDEFSVSGDPKKRARELLDLTTRQSLFEMRELFDELRLENDSVAIWTHHRIVAADAMDTLLTASLRAASAISSSKRPQDGPYRT